MWSNGFRDVDTHVVAAAEQQRHRDDLVVLGRKARDDVGDLRLLDVDVGVRHSELRAGGADGVDEVVDDLPPLRARRSVGDEDESGAGRFARHRTISRR